MPDTTANDIAPVKKWGRSTKLTTGIVQSVVRDGESLDYNITSYFGPTASQTFNGTVYYGEVIVIRSTSGEFSLGGDSGALVVTCRHRNHRMGRKNSTRNM